ncbi:unknown protein [Microcystis aeruginosa NIES-843]|uniref:Uncharacterized protein n=1 Tax=Microcystis aeruginosa (strain NIES-843 / IAM M-2473) TaxID=449447 RepID=B0JNM6_MICAN|nr:unknown protein [Microcystis aeruginosa NIES-843]
MAKNGEKLLVIPHKSLLNSNKQPHSTPPPNLSSILRFLLMNPEKSPSGRDWKGSPRKHLKLISND